jgi:hypothetical protein
MAARKVSLDILLPAPVAGPQMIVRSQVMPFEDDTGTHFIALAFKNLGVTGQKSGSSVSW